jgi:hypothetical protein
MKGTESGYGATFHNFLHDMGLEARSAPQEEEMRREVVASVPRWNPESGFREPDIPFKQAGPVAGERV